AGFAGAAAGGAARATGCSGAGRPSRARGRAVGVVLTGAPQVFETDGPAETEAVGAELAARLRAGDLVYVLGELGAGKTTLVRGACRALGVSGPVTSPTFAIAHRYGAAGGLVVAHVDLYRLAGLDTEDPELLADYLGDARITFVEWPHEGSAELGAPRVTVELMHLEGKRRRLEIREGTYSPWIPRRPRPPSRWSAATDGSARRATTSHRASARSTHSGCSRSLLSCSQRRASAGRRSSRSQWALDLVAIRGCESAWRRRGGWHWLTERRSSASARCGRSPSLWPLAARRRCSTLAGARRLSGSIATVRSCSRRVCVARRSLPRWRFGGVRKRWRSATGRYAFGS